MSIRYGVTLTLDPLSTAGVHRMRQLICNQGAAWAAEMFALQLPLAEFFRCDEGMAVPLVERLSRLADANRREAPRFSLPIQGTRTAPGSILLNFATAAGAEPVYALRRRVMTLLRETPGVALDPSLAQDSYQPGIYLLREASLPAGVFAEALEFADIMASRQQLSPAPKAWRLQLTRYESNAAGEDWSKGQWAADLRWRLLDSYPL